MKKEIMFGTAIFVIALSALLLFTVSFSEEGSLINLFGTQENLEPQFSSGGVERNSTNSLSEELEEQIMQGLNAWETNGSEVYFEDNKVYISAVDNTNEPIIRLISKQYSGDINIAFGFNTQEIQPVKAGYNRHLESVNKSYTCDYEFNYTTSPKHFMCYREHTFVNSTPDYTEILFERDFESGDLPAKTAYWTEQKEVWDDVSGQFEKTTFFLNNTDTWYYKENFNVNANQTYELKINLQPKYITTEPAKYWVAFWPSDKTIKEAIEAGQFYALDPWTVNLNTDIISYWKLDDNNLTDSLGANDGINQGSTNTSGIILDGRAFDGISQRIDTAVFNNISSLSFWFKIGDTSGGLIEVLGQQFDATERVGDFFFLVHTDGAIDFGVYEPALNYFGSLTTIVDDDAWHHVVIVSGTGGLRMYIDGDTASPEINDTTTVTLGDLSINNFTLGARGANGVWQYGNSSIDEVAIWDRRLTAAEAIQLYNGGSGIQYTDEFGNVPTVVLNAPANDTNIFQLRDVNFNASLVTDDINLVNVSVEIDGVINQTNSSGINGSSYNFLVTDLSDGWHNWTIVAFDNDSTQNTEEVRTFFIDFTEAPTVTLNEPTNSSVLFVGDINFSYTPTDNAGYVLAELFMNSSLVNFTYDQVVSYSNITDINKSDYGQVLRRDGVDYLFTLDTTYEKMTIFNVQDVATPTFVANASNGTCIQQALDFSPDGNYAYTASYSNSAFCVWDIINISNPTVISVLTNVTNLFRAENIYYVNKFGFDWAIVPANTFTNAINITDPYNPQIVSWYGDAHTGGSDAIFIDDYIYTTFDDYGIHVINFTDYTNMNLIAEYAMSSLHTEAIQQDRNNATIIYLTYSFGGSPRDLIRSYDIQDIENSLGLIDSYQNTSYLDSFDDFFVNDDGMTGIGMGATSGGVLLLNISNPFSITHASSTGGLPVQSADSIQSARIWMDNRTGYVYAFKNENVNGVQIYDLVSNRTLSGWGVRELNQTALVNNTINFINLTGLSQGTYLWNIRVTDDEGYSVFAPNNFTVTIAPEPDAPTVTLISPANNSYSSSQNITYEATAVSTQGIANVSYILDDVYDQTNTTGINDSSYFFNDTLSDGTYVWKIEACDPANRCTNQSRTINVDATFPSINLTAPINRTILTTGDTLWVNWSVSDTNLEECWYQYNNVNNTVTCGAGAQSFSYEGPTSLLFYANDTAGNIAIEPRAWTADLRIINETFSATTVETALEIFSIDLEYTSADWISATAILSYAGIGYVGTGSGAGDNVQFNYTLSVPSINFTINNTFNWTITLTNGTGPFNFSTTNHNQTVSKINFTLCDYSEDPQLFFQTFSTTAPTTAVNATFQSTWDIKDTSGGASVLVQSYQDLSETNSSWGFCIEPSITNYTVSVDITVDATDYTPTAHYIVDTDVSSPGENISIYLLNDSLSTLTEIIIRDQDNQPVQGALTTIQRYDLGTDTYYNVGMTRSDSSGSDLAYLNWFNDWYRFIIVFEGEVVAQDGPKKVSSTPQIFRIGEVAGSDYEKFRNIDYSLLFNESTDNFVLTFVETTGEVTEMCLRTIKRNVTQDYIICDVCETSSSATLYCNIAAWGNGTFIADFYATGSPAYWIEQLVQLQGGQNELYELIGNDDGTGMAIIFAGLVLAFFLISPALAVFGVILGMIGAIALGFQPLDYSAFIGIVVVGVAIMWAVQR